MTSYAMGKTNLVHSAHPGLRDGDVLKHRLGIHESKHDFEHVSTQHALRRPVEEPVGFDAFVRQFYEASPLLVDR